MSQHEQRTESATPQRLRKARSEGKFPASKELAFAVQFTVLVILLLTSGERLSHRFLQIVHLIIRHSCVFHPTSLTILHDCRAFAMTLLPVMACVGLIMIAAYTAVQLALTGFGLAIAKLTPDFNRLNPAPRLCNLFSRNLASCCESLVFIVLFSLALRQVIGHHFLLLYILPQKTMHIALLTVGTLLKRLLTAAVIMILCFGSYDAYRQYKRYAKQLRMTKHEVREEWKQTEGHPEIKLRVRRLRLELLRRRMMAAVPKATAVIVNPTQFAVALQYERVTMNAPRVVAKGKNLLAQRIRMIAREHNIPIMENPPLARALFKNCEVGQEIPEHFYKIVAEVLAYVYTCLNNK